MNPNDIEEELSRQITSCLSNAQNDNHRKYLNIICLGICAGKIKNVINSGSIQKNELVGVIIKIINDFKLPIQDLDDTYNIIHTNQTCERGLPALSPINKSDDQKEMVSVAYFLSESLVDCVLRSDIKSTKMLCEMGVKPICTHNGYSALHIAAKKNTQILKMLLDYAPNYVNIQTEVWQKTPLQQAVSKNKRLCCINQIWNILPLTSEY